MKNTILATPVLGLLAGRAIKHVVHHVEYEAFLNLAGNPTVDLRITSPTNLSRGVVDALPRLSFQSPEPQPKTPVFHFAPSKCFSRTLRS